MSKWSKQDICALCMAAVMLLTGACYPARPTTAWWGTAFSIAPEQSAEAMPNEDAEIVFRLRIVEWWQALAG